MVNLSQLIVLRALKTQLLSLTVNAYSELLEFNSKHDISLPFLSTKGISCWSVNFKDNKEQKHNNKSHHRLHEAVTTVLDTIDTSHFSIFEIQSNNRPIKIK